MSILLSCIDLSVLHYHREPDTVGLVHITRLMELHSLAASVSDAFAVSLSSQFQCKLLVFDHLRNLKHLQEQLHQRLC